MAVAISAPTLNDRTASQLHAATWTGISAGIALVLTVPLVVMLAGPISDLMFVRGSEYYNDWSRAFMVTLLIVAPAAYAMFFGITGELLKTRVPDAVHTTTVRVCAAGFVPFIAMMMIANFWTSGPQESFMISAGLTVPMAMIATIWASTQNH